MLDVQVLLAVVERCREGTEEVANPNDVEHVVDDVLHSIDNVVDLHLVQDALLNFDVDLSLDDFLDGFLVLDAADELQDLVLDDNLDLLGQHDVFLFLYDDVYIADVNLVLLTLDDLLTLDADHLADVSIVGHDGDLLFYQVVDVLDDDEQFHSCCRCQSPNCWCSHYDDDLLDVGEVETILLHMMSLLDDSILCLDATLLDELDGDNILDALLLANSSDAIHDVDHDPNIHDMANDATRPLGILPIDDPTLLLRWNRGTPDEVVQRCCRQLDVEAHDDVCSVLIHLFLFFILDVILDVWCQLLTCDVIDDPRSRWGLMTISYKNSMVLTLIVIDADHANMKLWLSMFYTAAWCRRRCRCLCLSLMSHSSGWMSRWQLLDVLTAGCCQQRVDVFWSNRCMTNKGSMFSKMISKILNELLMMSTRWWVLVKMMQGNSDVVVRLMCHSWWYCVKSCCKMWSESTRGRLMLRM